MVHAALTPEERARIDACTSSEEMAEIIYDVKAARGGHYPSDWWEVLEGPDEDNPCDP